MYMADFDLMVKYAYALRASASLGKDNIDSILRQMEADGLYNPRSGGSTFTGQFKVIQIAWYMFGYYDNTRSRTAGPKKFVFGPLGNLLLDRYKAHDADSVKRIFVTMLFGDPFKQPFSLISPEFNIYPFRLIFRLLEDGRLGGRLYSDEAFYLAMFVKTIDDAGYEELVGDILKLRARDPSEKFGEFKTNERIIGLACHEWRYLCSMLSSAGIVKINNDNGSKIIGTLKYGNGTASRSYRQDYITLNPDISDYVDILLGSYPVSEKPFSGEDLADTLSSERVAAIYSFFPEELSRELHLSEGPDRAVIQMLTAVNRINEYSHNEIRTDPEVFEEALTDAFNLFSDIRAEHVGGSGRTDIECIFLKRTNPDETRKFDADAKSTGFKLPSINSKRIKRHRDEIGSEYTIIVTPDFSVGVLGDVAGEKTVVIKSAALASYLTQYILKSGRYISFRDLDQIIVGNLGKDITSLINGMVFTSYGHGYEDFSIKEEKKDTPSQGK
jgi:type II restriction enzyme